MPQHPQLGQPYHFLHLQLNHLPTCTKSHHHQFIKTYHTSNQTTTNPNSMHQLWVTTQQTSTKKTKAHFITSLMPVTLGQHLLFILATNKSTPPMHNTSHYTTIHLGTINPLGYMTVPLSLRATITTNKTNALGTKYCWKTQSLTQGLTSMPSHHGWRWMSSFGKHFLPKSLTTNKPWAPKCPR